jgi:MoaA/NifB/PqqE/SkfB family radical SAM enzyme
VRDNVIANEKAEGLVKLFQQRLDVWRMFCSMVLRVPIGQSAYLWRRMANENVHRFAGQVRVNTFFPPWPSEAFERFCQAAATRRRVPNSLYLSVTHRCPYACGHCSAAGRSGCEWTRDEVLRVIGEAKSIGACTLGFTGGEPMLREELPQWIAAAAPELATIVFTTGAGLDDAAAMRLKRAGVTCVTIGVEFSDGQRHDAVRAVRGSFDAASAAASACRREGVYTAISTVATAEKIDSGELERLWALGRQWGVGEFRVLAPVATGRIAGQCRCILSQAHRERLKAFHIETNRRRELPAVACFSYLESSEMFGCGAGYHHLYIDASGEVCPCDLTPMSFGNARDESLAAVWQRMGQWFDRPRCGCFSNAMAASIGQMLTQTQTLPIDRAASEALAQQHPARGPLPEGYRRMLRS